MPALASLLGLPLAPVVSPLLLSTRLTKEELRAATAAFHRARGYHELLDLAHFRESVMQEAFVAMPVALMQRVFVVWSYLENERMSLKEFLVGAMIVMKGSRDEQLRFIFQLMDTSGSQELSKSDARLFLNMVACESEGGESNKIVAVEELQGINGSAKKLWTVDTFADLLHPTSELLTPAKFVKVLSGRKFSVLYLLDWIPVFATQFQVEWHLLPSPCLSPAHRNTQVKPCSPVPAAAVLPANNTPLRTEEPTPSIISPCELSAELLDTIRTECLSILDYLVNTGEAFTFDTFQQRFNGIVPCSVLNSVRCVEVMFPATHLSPSKGSKPVLPESESSRRRFKHLMITLLSAFATGVQELVRLLFAIFDDGSSGSLDVLQFATFLRFASPAMSHAESERTAFATIRHLSDSTVSSPPVSPSFGVFSSQQTQEHEAAPSVTFSAFGAFFRSAAYQDLELLSYAEMEILHQVVHLQLSVSTNGQNYPAAMARNGLKQFTKQLRLAKQMDASPHKQGTSELGDWFCLMERAKWNAILEIVCDANEVLAGSSDAAASGENENLDDAHDALANDIGVSVSEAKRANNGNLTPTEAADEKKKDEFVLVPMKLWVMLAFWQRNKPDNQHNKSLGSKKDWREWTTCVSFSSAPRTSDYQLTLRGFLVAVLLTFTGVDGNTATKSSKLQAIVSEQCSIQDLLDAVQLQQRRSAASGKLSRRYSVSECQLVLTDAQNATSAENQQPLSIPKEFRQIPLQVLMSTILPQDVYPESARRFELHASVVELVSPKDEEQPKSYNTVPPSQAPLSPSGSQFRRSLRLNASTGLSSVHGLANLGNTCFMNSALQCLVVTPLLREYFLHHEYLFDLGTRYASSHIRSPSSQLSSPSNSPKRGKPSSTPKTRKKGEVTQLPTSCFLPLAFGQLIAEMNAFSSTGTISGVCDVISPQRMQKAIAMLFPNLIDGSQQDAQEFLSSLLSSLSEELRRQPVVSSAPRSPLAEETQNPGILSPQSRQFLSRLPSFSRNFHESSGSLSHQSESSMEHEDPTKQLRFQIGDSNGRPDSTVANEWWISHLISEPSIITALFCGQFKSVLTCQACGTKSARFEPFSSLQLPIVGENSSHNAVSSSMTKRQLDVIVIVHFADPVAHNGIRSLRLAVQVEADWTLDQLLMNLQEYHKLYSLNAKRQYMACVVDGCRIHEFIDRDTLLITTSSALDVFELENMAELGLETERERSASHFDREFHVGDELLVWTPDDRYVKGMVTQVRQTSPRSVAAGDWQPIAQSQPSVTYDVMLNEGLSTGRSMRAVSRVRPISSSNNRVLFFRFVHRRQVLVPFYCKTPHRLALCGFPSIHRAHAANLTGKFLYRVAQERFLPQFATRTFKSDSASSYLTNTLVIRRVTADGKSCSCCHWSSQCVGCVVPRSSDVVDDSAMDETFAIDWNLEPFANVNSDRHIETQRIDKHEIEVLLTQKMLAITDDASYESYRQNSSHSLERSLKILCNSESLEANCSKCPSRPRNRTKTSETSEEGDENSRMLTRPTASLHTKELSLWSVPPILIIQLKRFELTPGSYTWRKVDHCVDFPIENLNLSAFLGVEEGEFHSQRVSTQSEVLNNTENVTQAAAFLHTQLSFPLDTASRDCTGYSLYGIVNHSGDIGSGHYTAHLRHPQSDDWWLADDSVGIPVNIQKLTPSSAAYLLFYVRHDLLSLSGSEELRGAAPEPKRLSSFFPRQKLSVKLSDERIQSVWQNEKWYPSAAGVAAVTRSQSNSSSTSLTLPPAGGDTSDKGAGACNFM